MNKSLSVKHKELLSTMDNFLNELSPGLRNISTIYLTVQQFALWKDIEEKVEKRWGHYIQLPVDNGQYRGYKVVKYG
jgi:hypothetical protein